MGVMVNIDILMFVYMARNLFVCGQFPCSPLDQLAAHNSENPQPCVPFSVVFTKATSGCCSGCRSPSQPRRQNSNSVLRLTPRYPSRIATKRLKWTAYQPFPRNSEVEDKGDAQRTAESWANGGNTIQTDYGASNTQVAYVYVVSHIGHKYAIAHLHMGGDRSTPVLATCILFLTTYTFDNHIMGNEVADQYAKEAAGGQRHSVPDELRWGASLSHLTRVATKNRSVATAQWVSAHIRLERRYSRAPPRRFGPPKKVVTPCQEAAGQSVFPATRWTRSNLLLSPRKDDGTSEQGVERVSVMPLRQEGVALPPLRRVQSLGAADPEAMEASG